VDGKFFLKRRNKKIMWTLDGKFTNWKVEKKSRNVSSFSSVVETIETNNNILDEYAAKNDWNF
jgi:hypothetical protein